MNDFPYIFSPKKKNFPDDLKPRFPNLNINEGNKAGRTALMQAAKHGHVEMMKLLLRFGASPNIRMRDGEFFFFFFFVGGGGD